MLTNKDTMRNTINLVLDLLWFLAVAIGCVFVYDHAYDVAFQKGYDSAYDTGYEAGWSDGTSHAEMGFCTDLGASDWFECQSLVEELYI